MKSQTMSVWVPFGFSVTLSAIVLTANIAGAFVTGNANVGMIPFVSFLPMAFFFVAASQRQTRDQIDALEARIHQLEAAQAAA